MHPVYALLLFPDPLGINTAAFRFASAVASPILTSMMQALAESYVAVLPLIAIFFVLRKDKNMYGLAAGVLLAAAVGETIKLIVQEPRPCSILQIAWMNSPPCESGFSFPSEHATTLTGIPIFMGKYGLLRGAYVVWLALVLFGRVYLGQHYLTDVFAGMALSIIIVYTAYQYSGGLFRALRKNGLAVFNRK